MPIKIFAVGGTIDKIYFDDKSDYQVGDPQALSVLKRSNVVVDYNIESLLKKDSLDMDDADRELVRNAVEAESSDKIIITHGTDSMILTAKALQNISGKTIVMTGSMFPALYRDSDADFNMGCALASVQTLEHGVYIAMNGRIFDPKNTVKNVALNRFEDKS